jgi:hypothetical protein
MLDIAANFFKQISVSHIHQLGNIPPIRQGRPLLNLLRIEKVAVGSFWVCPLYSPTCGLSRSTLPDPPTLEVFIVHRQRGILLVTGFPHLKCEYLAGSA